MVAEIVGPIVGVVVFILFIYTISKGIKIVKEREVLIIERLGKFHSVLNAGMHFIIPYIDRPKTFWYCYFEEDMSTRQVKLVERYNIERILTQNQVMDFPRQRVITRDNAAVSLDAVLSYKVVNPKQMIYSVTNLPYVLSQLLQAQLRNVAGSLNIDQIIEESSSLNVLTGLMDSETTRWGVQILFVKIQRIEAYGLTDVLAKKKNADLKNKEIIINAKAKKQTLIIESEGKRDSAIKKAEGAAQEITSRARGEAQAVINSATAEAKTVREIARALAKDGPQSALRYLLGIKYIETLRKILSAPGTQVEYVPQQSTLIQTAQEFGLNTIYPPQQVAR